MKSARGCLTATRLGEIILAILVALPVCALATDITFTSSGTITDGNVYRGVFVENDGTVVDMLGGEIGGVGPGYLSLTDNSTFNLFDGQIHIYTAIDVYGTSTMNVWGGTIYGVEFGMGPDAHILFSGGNVGIARIKAHDGGTIDIKGGFFECYSIEMGGYDIWPTINIYGYGFNYEYVDQWILWRLTGYLMDDSPLLIEKLSQNGLEHLNLIPEPATLLLLCAGGFFVRKRG